MANYDSSPITPFAESFFLVICNHSLHYLRPISLNTQALSKLVQHNKQKMSPEQQFRCRFKPLYAGRQAGQHTYLELNIRLFFGTDYFIKLQISTPYIKSISNT